MPEDMYTDEAPETGAPAESKAPEEKDDSTGETAVLPKSILQGKDFNPGDELVLVVKAIHDDQIEVAYAPPEDQEHGEGQEPEEKEAEGNPGGGGGGMASMMY